MSFENYETPEELFLAMDSTNGRLPTSIFDPQELIAHYNAGKQFEDFRDAHQGGPTHREILREMGLV